ncbi:MAG TPA: sugar phosphate isomerase/epimerase family protein [Methylomusa anaerophila]|uniref:Xylose isomerase-like TIM barrel n=1 Tax=Methylomusa anaerophila TaxID=1930071 RepID=A0A348AH73_9FIRM|nr:sugar phosphate isomerase/epimerase family protein [Methylomusa anaerophila]BBB90421.1 Xylose isomerase-like TIM barrel [Methylomusa anaerophila]HML90364.1 sugar phosphate isomerase/epimerase family protein [Methylomusa anaerophila]
MDFGLPTLIEMKSLDDCAALCKELNFQFIELNMNLPEYQADKIDADTFAQIAERYGIYYTIHLDENLNPCDFNEKVACAYTETVLQAIELATQLRIPVLNMHLSKGVYFTLPEKKVYLFDEYLDTYLDKLTAFRDRCEQAIGGADIKICVENADGYDKEFLRKGLALLLESKTFALTFDIGHNAGIGGGDEEVIMKYKNKLCHMHMHDAKGKNNHLPLGAGELDLPKYFYLAKKQNCRVVLETKTAAGLKESVEWIKSRKPVT